MFYLCFAGLLQAGLAIQAFSEPREPRPLGEAAPALVLGGTVTMAALDAFADAEADAEMGQDLGMDLALEHGTFSTGDPATLAEYCSGAGEAKEAKMGEGTRVKADWNNYGQKYPGKVTEVNKDGTVDVHYNDGFDEKNIDPDDVRLRKPKKAGAFIDKLRAASPKDDPACKLQEFLKKMQDQLKNLNGMLSKWLGAQRAKMAQDDEVPAPPPKVVAAPKAAPTGTTGAPPSKDQASDLEKLKAELGDLDKYIKELEKKEAEYDEEIQQKKNPALAGAPAAAPGVKTVDDLIAEYTANIAKRNARVKELLKRIKEQKEELAELGKDQLSLKDIDAAIDQLEKDVESGKKKRDELKKAGELDPELRAVIDDIIKAFSKMRKKVHTLMALEIKAKAERAKAEQEAELAAAAAKKKAKEEGKNDEEAEADAAAASKKAKEKARKADMETMAAANEVNEDLKKAEKSATKLDTGLHPHGDKWWRYRYEHSYIEAVLMIFISFLMLLWSEFWRHARYYVNSWSKTPPSSIQSSNKSLSELEWDDLEEETHQAFYVLWLHFLAEQMLVCIFVFLTVWVIAKTSLVDLFPLVILPSKGLHVPHTGEEYRILALDICTIFFFAIVFYFGLMFSVAREMGRTIDELNEPQVHHSNKRKSGFDQAAQAEKRAMGVVQWGKHFHDVQKYFVNNISRQMTARDDPELKEISRTINDDWNNFPLSQYLKLHVRMNGVGLFSFSWSMWLPTICLFLCLMLLHRFAHMGYIRIMGFAAVLVLFMVAGIVYLNRTVTENMFATAGAEEDQAAPEEPVKDLSIHEKWPTQTIVLNFLQFALFFVCYGTARMICQPWMWELHFWPVLILSIVAVITAAIFCVFVAPSLPSFLCVMSLPPYVSPHDKGMMKVCASSFNKPPTSARGFGA